MDTSMDAESLTTGNDLVPVREAVPSPQAKTTIVLPVLLTSAGDDAVTRFAEYFTVTIQNPHTRRAYFRNAVSFLRWCDDRGVRAALSDQRLHRPAMPARTERALALIDPLRALGARFRRDGVASVSRCAQHTG